MRVHEKKESIGAVIRIQRERDARVPEAKRMTRGNTYEFVTPSFHHLHSFRMPDVCLQPPFRPLSSEELLRDGSWAPFLVSVIGFLALLGGFHLYLFHGALSKPDRKPFDVVTSGAAPQVARQTLECSLYSRILGSLHGCVHRVDLERACLEKRPESRSVFLKRLFLLDTDRDRRESSFSSGDGD